MNILNQVETIDEAYASSASAHTGGRVIPRWKRKANERSNKLLPTTPSRQTPVSGKVSTHKADRFIPNRSAMDADSGHIQLTATDDFEIENDNSNSSNEDQQRSAEYEEKLRQLYAKSKILAFKNKAPQPKLGSQNAMKVVYSQARSETTQKASKHRHIMKMPVRSLDLPDVVDDFYLNILDWSEENVIGVGVANTVYFWHATSGAASQLMQTDEDDNIVTSLKFSSDGGYVAVGLNNNLVEIWDAEKATKLRTLEGHNGRVAALAWNGPLVSSGSADSGIINHDVRVEEHRVAELHGHVQEVCGLKWNTDGGLLASGANDNLVKIWDSRRTDLSKFTFSEHKAAVKALDWAPWQRNLLATGGGMSDRMIYFWNTATGMKLSSIDAASQVSSLQWSLNSYELVSAHGFNKNKLSVWKYPSLTNIADLHGHTGRIFHMALSPDGRLVASVAGDETMRIWKVFDKTTHSKKGRSTESSKGGQRGHRRHRGADLGSKVHLR